MVYLIFAITGFLVGIISSLLGIGGGVILVPLFWHIFPKLGISEPLSVKSSIATSLSLITCMSLSSSRVHLQRGTISYRTILKVGVASFAGVVIGSIAVSSNVNPDTLKKLFSILLIIVSLRLLKEPPERKSRNVKPILPISGFLSGVVSSSLGIGGGVVANPLLFSFTKLKSYEVVAVGSAITFLNAFFGTVSYIALNQVNQKAFFGPIFLPAFIATLPSAVIGSKIGARLSYRVNRIALKRVFSLILIAVALKLILK